MVISPGVRKRSVYIVRGTALNSIERNDIELEHVFDL